ncbi:hypothetical protein Clacol_009343 [Clathrus columnatus]|uniref:Cytochrome P450 n=1 Tax=Clathrus columnatus TaxID=1419009 RepID=A0AAV5APV1_9AGAM|nr:hypothetical protein Clacol_009343 [Clathrus columnatus]
MTWIQVCPKVRAMFVIANPNAAKEVVSNRARFPKPTATYAALQYFGSNILTTEGEEWKHQRKLTAPTFSEKNNRLVWEETIRVIEDMFSCWGVNNQEVPVNHCLDITLPITLTVISGAGFGRRIPWSEDTIVPPGHKMSFKTALHTASVWMIFIVVLPKWVFWLSKKLRNAYLAKDELVSYMQEIIEQRRANLDEERYDLFNALLKVNESSTKEEGRLGEDELFGNIFIFLLAGHETTAHTMCFILGILAIEQEEQEKLFQHILSILGDRYIPNYEEFNTLSYVMAVINETLRLFPSVTILPKVAAEDTTLPVTLPDGRVESVFIQGGTEVFINITGLHYNPFRVSAYSSMRLAKYWDDPNAFNPSRFLGNHNRDAFMPFSAGARACIGRGFGETEMVAALTMIIRKYKVEVKNPEAYVGMNKFEQREKLLANRAGLTVTPLSVPLVFKKRNS